MEHFYTLQGEGFHTGRAAYFIRLGGCDVGCVWCDVKESWDASAHPQYGIPEMVEWVMAARAPMVVITGGEPAMHLLDPLCQTLHRAGIQRHLETSGAHEIRGDFDWITLSPKKFKAPVPSALSRANELKVVVFNQSDFAWAEQHASAVDADCRLYLQPEWSKKDKITPFIVDYIKQNPQWQLSLQTHKYINIS
jgi:organic radical activating enzyme